MQIIGRSSSHFTRVTRIFAHELGVDVELVPIRDLASLDETAYGGNPARKLPTLRRGGALLFGTANICRALAEAAVPGKRVVWPEEVTDDLSRNAQELVWHAMTAQVQLVFGTVIAKLPADNLYFTKARTGLDGALRWLDDHLPAALAALPTPRDLSLLEVTLFCLIDFLAFRPTVPADAYPALLAFARAFAERPSAQATPFRFDFPS